MKSIASIIDHTLLRPDATGNDIRRLCQEAVEHQFYSVCVNPIWVSLCNNTLFQSNVLVCSVVGFPLGANRPQIKVDEAKLAFDEGAREIDMVLPISCLKTDHRGYVYHEIQMVRKAVPEAVLKVIIEACLLTNKEKELACKIAVDAGANFVKTSTGLSSGGATIEDVSIMKSMVGGKVGVKAAGGIGDFGTANAMVLAGANRIGTRSSVKIVKEEKQLNIN